MEVYVVIKEICTSLYEIPEVDCVVFDTSKKAMDYIRTKYQEAMEDDYKNEYKEFLETPNENEREQEGLFEFEFDEENCGFEIYRNGAYIEEHYFMYMHRREVE